MDSPWVSFKLVIRWAGVGFTLVIVAVDRVRMAAVVLGGLVSLPMVWVVRRYP